MTARPSSRSLPALAESSLPSSCGSNGSVNSPLVLLLLEDRGDRRGLLEFVGVGVRITVGGLYNRRANELKTTLIDDIAMAMAATVGGRRVRVSG
jgi:hypothetical protein